MKDEQVDPEQARWEARLNSRHFRGHPDYGKGQLSPRAERLFASAILAVFVVLAGIALWLKW